VIWLPGDVFVNCRWAVSGLRHASFVEG
jgi:hypothetical protein